MLLNYHEMTMNEPADSRNKRTQFLVVCSVMVSVLVYTLMTSGIFYPIDATEGVFPGGNFVYKFTYRDYAASMGLGRLVRKDWIQQNFETTDDSKQKKENDETVEAFTYHVYLDDPSQMGGRRQRWMSGLLARTKVQEKFFTFCRMSRQICLLLILLLYNFPTRVDLCLL